MKEIFVGLTILTLISVGVTAYADGLGWFGGGYTHMMGPWYGSQIMEWGGYDQKFSDETVDVRNELYNKQFEYSEALRNPNTKPETITKLAKEIQELQGKLYTKAPRGTNRGFRHCWEY